MTVRYNKLNLVATDVCPKCGSADTTCADSRNYYGFRRRSRKCNVCLERWFTIEVTETDLNRMEDALTLVGRLTELVGEFR